MTQRSDAIYAFMGENDCRFEAVVRKHIQTVLSEVAVSRVVTEKHNLLWAIKLKEADWLSASWVSSKGAPLAFNYTVHAQKSIYAALESCLEDAILHPKVIDSVCNNVYVSVFGWCFSGSALYTSFELNAPLVSSGAQESWLTAGRLSVLTYLALSVADGVTRELRHILQIPGIALD